MKKWLSIWFALIVLAASSAPVPVAFFQPIYPASGGGGGFALTNSTAWSPVFWIRADDPSFAAIPDGTAIGDTWPNRSGSTNDSPFQATALSQPLYQTNEKNGLPLVSFDGVSHIMQFTPTTLTNYVVFMVFRSDSATIGWQGPICYFTNTTPAIRGFLFVGNDNATQWKLDLIAVRDTGTELLNTKVQVAQTNGNVWLYSFAVSNTVSVISSKTNTVDATLAAGASGFGTSQGALGKSNPSTGLKAMSIGEIFIGVVTNWANVSGDISSANTYFSRWGTFP